MGLGLMVIGVVVFAITKHRADSVVSHGPLKEGTIVLS